MSANKMPTATLDLSDTEVKRRTRYLTMAVFLSYLFIVCDGDIALLQQRNSSLTWFEEWSLHFEYKWGRTTTRIWDSVATDCAGNERAVNMSKRVWFLSRSFGQNISPKRMRDAWLTWFFQANFTFNTVL